MTLRRQGAMGECKARTQGAPVAGGYGCDRGRRIAPTGTSRRPRLCFETSSRAVRMTGTDTGRP
jgi:hypothetical protein